MDKLFKELRAEAVRLNACHKGIVMLDELDKECVAKDGHGVDEKGLIGYWKKNIEFAVKADFPKVEYIKENFNVDVLHGEGVYVDESFDLRGRKGMVVALGEARGTVVNEGFEVLSLHIRHKSEVKVVAEGFAKLFVHCYEDSKVEAICGEHAVIYVYKHGNSSVKCKGSVIIREKSLKKE